VTADEHRSGAGDRLGAAELLADLDRPSGWVLLIDRVRQSYVDLDDPTYLDFEYMQCLAEIVDALDPGPLAVTHVGGGAATLARYVAATRPGSSQIILEPVVAMTELGRCRLPFPRGARIRIRPVDGRAGMAALADASADVVILDAFHGARVPAELTSAEFVADVARVLRADGVLLINIADGPPLGYVRRVVATVVAALGEVVLIGDAGVLRGRRFGNLEIAASRAPLPMAAIERASAGAMFPRRVLSGADLAKLVGRAAGLTDADSMRSPAPPEEAWRVEYDE
jgi:SAM-dependent methyltransferase